MAISPIALSLFLDMPIPHVPDFKRMAEDELHATIFRVTGQHYKPKTFPHKHQLVGVAAGIFLQRCLWHYEMRLGKTKMSLDWAEHLRMCGTFRRKALVIVPFPLAVGVFVADAKIHSRLHVVGVGKEVSDLLDAADSTADVIVMSWSGLQTIFTQKSKKGGLEINKEALLDAAELFDLSILDEIHTCNNTSTLRFEMATLLVSKSAYRAGMSGTPLGRDKLSVWAQAFLVDEGKTLGRSEHFFRAAFGRRVKDYWARGGFKLVFDDDKTELLARKLNSIAVAYQLAEVREIKTLPGVVSLDMLPEQRKYYRETIDKVIKSAQLDQILVENTFVRLRQISSGFLSFKDDDKEQRVIHFKSSKMEWLKDLLTDVPPEICIVIFYEFTETGRTISELLTAHKRKHSWLWSGTKDPTKALTDFQAGKVNVLLANTRSAWGSVDLQRADYQLFFESTPSPILRKQVEFRALGPARGDRPLLLDDLVCSPTEQRILTFLQEGKDAMADLIFTREAWRSLLV